jgi:predicted Zn-dependent peptidase
VIARLHSRRVARTIAAATAASLLTALPLAAQVAVPVTKDGPSAAALDRGTPPPVGPAPALNVPAWTTSTLSNGARLVVAPKRDLPLVSVTVTFEGGANQFAPADKPGVAGFAASMLAEGTATKTAEQLAEAQQLLGVEVRARIDDERGSIGFQALRDRWVPAMELAADMMLNPTLPADALERIRARSLVSLRQAKDQPSVISSNVFARTLYGDAHPYGRVPTEQALRAITRDDVVAFHRAYFQPARAIITVTGDVEPAQVRQALERVLAAWPAGGAPASFDYPAPPAARGRTIYLVDKPKAAQSSFNIGLVGPPRSTEDYHALLVLNRILGGHIQSRLSHNIREVKGYSYGVGSSFAFGKGPGPFRAGGEIVTAKTDSALIEFMRELRGIHGERPFTQDELAEARQALVQSLPRSFGSVGALSGSITNIYVEGLPEDYYQRFAERIEAVTIADLERVAHEYVDLDRLAIVIVGDRATIETPLARTGIAPIVVLDGEGRPVPPKVTP